MDIHAVAGVLKLYLREIPECIFTNKGMKDLIAASKLTDVKAKVERFVDIFRKIPVYPHQTCIRDPSHLCNVQQSLAIRPHSMSSHLAPKHT